MENNSFSITIVDDRANIFTPFNSEFVKRVKLFGGRLNAAAKCWSVPASAVDPVRELMRGVYGRDDLDSGTLVTIKLTFNKTVCKTCDAITVFGKCVAAATGRDSGARVGVDVCFLTGTPDSGGSARYWETVIPSGSTVVLHNVSLSLVDENALPDGVEYTFVGGDTAKRSALCKEKEKLLARIADIDAQIAMLRDDT